VLDTVRNVGQKTYFRKDQRWQDSTVTPEQAKNAIRVVQFSKEYFDLAAAHGGMLAKYIAFDSAADELAAAADGLFAHADALITLSALGEAPPASQPGSGALCMPWSLAGLPAMSLPLSRGARGLPIGIQLIGRRGDDAKLLSVAAWITDAAIAKAPEPI